MGWLYNRCVESTFVNVVCECVPSVFGVSSMPIYWFKVCNDQDPRNLWVPEEYGNEHKNEWPLKTPYGESLFYGNELNGILVRERTTILRYQIVRPVSLVIDRVAVPIETETTPEK